jgi:hypothetical protein
VVAHPPFSDNEEEFLGGYVTPLAIDLNCRHADNCFQVPTVYNFGPLDFVITTFVLITLTFLAMIFVLSSTISLFFTCAVL